MFYAEKQFMQTLFGDIPKFFESEEQLIKIWSVPETREKLLETLSEAGYSEEQLGELRKLVHGEESDLFDVLQYIAFSNPAISRKERVDLAEDNIYNFIII
mgnify:CR=1 FL=1